MWTRKSYLSIILVLMLLLTGSASLSCACESLQPRKRPQEHQEPVEKGDPDWWKKQPDLKKEETAINETITNLRAAFTAKDTEKALTYLAPDDREKFKTHLFQIPGYYAAIR